MRRLARKCWRADNSGWERDMGNIVKRLRDPRLNGAEFGWPDLREAELLEAADEIEHWRFVSAMLAFSTVALIVILLARVWLS